MFSTGQEGVKEAKIQDSTKWAKGEAFLMLSAFRGQRGPDRERGEAERGRQVWRRVRGRGRGSRPGDDFAAYLQGRSSPAQEEPGTEAEGGRWP